MYSYVLVCINIYRYVLIGIEPVSDYYWLVTVRNGMYWSILVCLWYVLLLEVKEAVVRLKLQDCASFHTYHAFRTCSI